MHHSRRDFLKSSGIALLGSSFSLYGLNTSSPYNDRINIGIIGTGDRGQGLASHLQHFPSFSVEALCDNLPFRIKDAKNKNPEAKTYEDYRKLLENKDIDAVIIATPLSEHFQMAMDALDAGKDVYCEKTMVFYDHEVLQLVEKAKSSSQIFQVGHQYRATPLYFEVADLIQSGKIGDVVQVYIQWNRNGNWRRPVPHPKYERQVNWRMYREYSGGLTAELLSHQLDFVHYIFDTYPLSVMGRGGIDFWNDGRETFDNVNLLYTYPDGLKVNAISLTSNAHEGYLMTFHGSKATLQMNMEEAWIIPEKNARKEYGIVDGVSGATVAYDRNNYGIPVTVEQDHPDWTNTDYALDAFANSIQNRTLPYSNVSNGGKTALAVRMGLDAMIEEEIIQWKEDYDVVNNF